MNSAIKRLLVEAGAGCGKTYNLVETYFNAINTGKPALRVPEVLALTFTEDAAHQMKERILERLASPTHALLRESVVNEAQVSTFHSLCYRLVRPHLRTLGYEQDTLVSPQSAKHFRARHILNCLATAPESAKLLMHLPSEKICELGADLWFRAREFTAESLQLQAENMQKAFRNFCQSSIVFCEEAFSKDPQLKDEQKGAWLFQFYNAVKDPLGASPGSMQFNGGKALKAEFPELFERAQAFREFLNEKLLFSLEHETLSKEVQMQEQLFSFLKQAQLKGPKLLDFSAIEHEVLLLSRTHRLIAPPRLLLVDEMQDTNGVQFEILKNISSADTQWYFVGDPKQSIYSFRKADVSLFLNLKETLELQSLDTNWRSIPQLLTFMNNVQQGLFSKSSISSQAEPEPQSLKAAPSETKFGSLTGLVHIYESSQKKEHFEKVFMNHYHQRVKELGLKSTHAALFLSWPRLFQYAQFLEAQKVTYVVAGAEPYLKHQLTDLFCLYLEGLFNEANVAAQISLEHWRKGLAPIPALPTLPTPSSHKATLNWSELFRQFCKIQQPERWPRGPSWVSAMERFVASLESEDLPLQFSLLDLAKYLAKTAAWAEIEMNHLQATSSNPPLTLMTIHGSKGLEFDAVYLPQLYERSIQENADHLEDEHSEAINLERYSSDGRKLFNLLFEQKKHQLKGLKESEQKRLFYVAVTRAKQTLNIYLHSPPKKPASPSLKLVPLGIEPLKRVYWNQFLVDQYQSNKLQNGLNNDTLRWEIDPPSEDAVPTGEFWANIQPVSQASATLPPYFRGGVSQYLELQDYKISNNSNQTRLPSSQINGVQRGQQLHALLERWNGDVETLPMLTSGLDKESANCFRQILLSLRALPELANYWIDLKERPALIQREFGLFILSPQFRLSGFADALWYKSAEELVIIDWKTTQNFETLSRPARLMKIKNQMNLYAKAFEATPFRIYILAVGISFKNSSADCLFFEPIKP